MLGLANMSGTWDPCELVLITPSLSYDKEAHKKATQEKEIGRN